MTKLRRDAGLTLGQFARLMEVGPATASEWERGHERMTDDQTTKAAGLFGVTTGELLASLPTPADAAKRRAHFDDVITAMLAAKADAKSKGFGKGHAGQAELECPVCKSTLRYSVAAINGHMMAACSTQGCARWME